MNYKKRREALVNEIVNAIAGKNSKKKIVGLCEKITIRGSKKSRNVIAKIDTGASDSSISVKLFKDIGETPVIREVIVQRAHEQEKRPLVRLAVKFAGKWVESEFTVSHRENMEYGVLIGDNTLRKMHVLVDPERKK